jgi:hypothetical protein
MKIGRAQRMQARAEAAGLDDFVRLFRKLKKVIGHKEKKAALDILAQITTKRIRMLSQGAQASQEMRVGQDTQA